MMPQIEIDLAKIKHNTRTLVDMFHPEISVAGVTKGVCGDPEVARAMLKGGVAQLADSRIMNIKRMREAGLDTRFILLRSPMASMVDDVVTWADSSLVSQMETIRILGSAALEQGKEHGIIIMIDMGDRREGILPSLALEVAEDVLEVDGVKLEGIGTNLACYGGVIPTMKKMVELARISNEIEKRLGIKPSVVSGGNSANIPLMMNEGHPKGVNHMRLGESILLGLETVGRSAIPGTHQDTFVLTGELVEVSDKPSVPDGTIGQDAFGGVPEFEDRGIIREGLLALGRQDMDPGSLTPRTDGFRLMGANSDYTILEVPPGTRAHDKLAFIPGYGSLLQAMTSPYVEKIYV